MKDFNYFKNIVYVDSANDSIIEKLEKENPDIQFIIRDKDNWNIKYIVNLIMDPNLVAIVIHDINELSIAEITLASFMCKKILCITQTIKEYDKIIDMVTDIQPGCNLNINNNSFIHWYNTIKK